ncbi:MAG: hypothetical protein KME38_30225 [Spirirestis rafaelensis WJT71-NPBG6]|nr:hypothetical protein [Spirirestis rafaelensis WJT71-NPBG6]
MKDLQEDTNFELNDSHNYQQPEKSDFNILEYIHVLTENPEDKNKYICPNCNANDLSINKSTSAFNCWSGCGDAKAIRRKCHELAGESSQNKQHYNSVSDFPRKQQHSKQESSENKEFKLGRLNSVPLPDKKNLGNLTNKKGVVQYNCIETVHKYAENKEVIRLDFYTDSECTKKDKRIWIHNNLTSAPQATWKPYRYEEISGQKALLWVEGEKCVDVTREKLGITTITNRAGSEPLLIEVLKESGIQTLVILPDNDAAGKTKANKIIKTAENSGINVVLLDITKFWKECPAAQDIVDWITDLESKQLNPHVIIEQIENDVNQELKKKNRLEEQKKYLASNNLYEVQTTVEETILKALFELKKDWVVFNNNFYQYSKDSLWVHISDIKVEKLATEYLRKLYILAKDEHGNLIKVYRFAGEKNKKNSIAFCRSFLSKELPSDHNQHLIAFDNGVLDTRVGYLLPHSKDYFLTHKIEGNYEKSNTCPEFVLNYFTETLGEENLDLLRAVISMMLDPNAPFGFFVHFVGQSGGGKGTLISLIHSLLPPENVTSLGTFKEIASPEKRHQYLSQSRLAYFEDLGGFQSEVRDFYKLVDNHPLNGRQLNNATGYTRHWNCRFMLASVLELQIENAGDGWMRRLIKFKLKRRDTKKIDSQLKNKLKAYRVEIINWALGMDCAKRNELIETARFLPQMAELNAEQARSSSSVLQFIDSCLASSENDSDTLESASLYDNYKSFCDASGLKAFNYSLFVSHLKDRIFNHFVDRKQSRMNGKVIGRTAHWKNIKFSSAKIFESYADIINCNKEEFQNGGLEEFDNFSFTPKIVEAEKINQDNISKAGDIIEIIAEDEISSEVVRIVQKTPNGYTCLNQAGKQRLVTDLKDAICFNEQETEEKLKELNSTPKQFGFPKEGTWIKIEGKLAYVQSIEASCYTYKLQGEQTWIPTFKEWEAIDPKKYAELGLQSGVQK